MKNKSFLFMFMFIILSIPLLMVMKEQKMKSNIDFMVDCVPPPAIDYESN